MAKTVQPKQWDVWFVELRPGLKGEQTGRHNVVVLSDDRVNAQRGVALVAPLTTTKRVWPWIVRVSPHEAGVDQVSWVECDQLQAVATSPERFLERRQRLGDAACARVAIGVNDALRGVLAIPDPF